MYKTRVECAEPPQAAALSDTRHEERVSTAAGLASAALTFAAALLSARDFTVAGDVHQHQLAEAVQGLEATQQERRFAARILALIRNGESTLCPPYASDLARELER